MTDHGPRHRRLLGALAGYVDGDQLINAVRDGYKRGKGSLHAYDLSR